MSLRTASITTTVLLLSPTLISSFCTTFTQRAQSGSVFSLNVPSQSINVSTGYVCQHSYSPSFDPGHYGSCTTYNPATNNTDTGCRLNGSGDVSAVGFTNLTNPERFSDAELDTLFQLVANQSDAGSRGIGFVRTAESCMNPEALTACIFSGDSGYMQWMPRLVCTEGILGGCSVDDNDDDNIIEDGTPVTVCGITVTNYFSPYSSSDVTMQSIGFSGGFVNTTADEARAVTADPSANATCTNFYHESAAFGAVKPRGVAVGLGILAVVGFLAT